VFISNEDQKKRQDAEPEQRDLVGDRPEATFHFEKNNALREACRM
jgi:hypothetical protein